MSLPTDEHLIAQIILYDDHKSFEELIGRHQNDIRNLLLKLVNFNNGDVDDLSQEAFIRVYKYLKTFKGDASFKTWIYTITYRVFIDAQKKNNKYYQLKSEKKIINGRPIKVQPRMDSKMDAEIIISCLRPEEKVAIQLSYLQGFTHKDIAAILECPIGTVKSHINRGKERIRKLYKTK